VTPTTNVESSSKLFTLFEPMGTQDQWPDFALWCLRTSLHHDVFLATVDKAMANRAYNAMATSLDTVVTQGVQERSEPRSPDMHRRVWVHGYLYIGYMIRHITERHPEDVNVHLEPALLVASHNLVRWATEQGYVPRDLLGQLHVTKPCMEC